MGVHDSYQDTFTSLVVDSKVWGSDRRVEKLPLQERPKSICYTAYHSEVDMSARLQSIQPRSQSIGLSIRLRGNTGNAEANYLITFQLERKGGISMSEENVEKSFSID